MVWGRWNSQYRDTWDAGLRDEKKDEGYKAPGTMLGDGWGVAGERIASYPF